MVRTPLMTVANAEMRTHWDLTRQEVLPPGAQPFHIAAVTEIGLLGAPSPPLGVGDSTTFAPRLGVCEEGKKK